MAVESQPVRPAHTGISLTAGVLSYLVPGLGQISQGRVGKGLLFLVCLYGLFFYGMALGSWKNVYIPYVVKSDPSGSAQRGTTWLPTPLANVYYRLQYAGQFWIGVAAWPAIWQYVHYDPDVDKDKFLGDFQRCPIEGNQYELDDSSKPEVYSLNRLQREGNKSWDLAWVYTVIAGVLNILVIYDALAGPAFADGENQARRTAAARGPTA